MGIDTKDIIAMAAAWSRDFELEGNDSSPTVILDKTLEFLSEECDETEDALALFASGLITGSFNDLERGGDDLIDGFADVAFIALNGIYKTLRGVGLDHDSAAYGVAVAMESVCAANDAKRQPDGTVLKVNGKVQKPDGWRPPSHKELLRIEAGQKINGKKVA